MTHDRKYRVYMQSRPAVGCTFYDGKVDVVALNDSDAEEIAIRARCPSAWPPRLDRYENRDSATMTREEVIEFAKVASRKQLRVTMLGRTNVSGQSPEQRVDLDAEYRVASAEAVTAERAYQEALRVYQEGKLP